MAEINKYIEKAVAVVGSQKLLADLCNVKQQTVSLWLKGVAYSAKHAYRIEKATNGLVTSSELCQALDELDRK
ncbi:transcriptional regulator [Lonepinella sp. BR2919]|uniref:transcriptional regulator n=1 Tax=unclassified Lonepinella TaxID=2642006 RepID=UPI003F6E1E17